MRSRMPPTAMLDLPIISADNAPTQAELQYQNCDRDGVGLGDRRRCVRRLANRRRTGCRPDVAPRRILPGAPPPNGLEGNQRSLEYDTMSGRYASFLLEEILPDVGKQKTSDGRAIRFSRRCFAPWATSARRMGR